MRKFFFTLLLLLLLGGAGFFFGWVQLEIPVGSYGIISSKTHGTDPRLAQSGEFRWLWYKLIPTNVKIAVFRLETCKFPLSYNSVLPSGKIYSAFAGLGESDFAWSINGEIGFKISPDFLVPLVSSGAAADQQALDARTRDIANNISVIIARTLSSEDTDAKRLEKILAGSTDAEMEREIAGAFPEISDFSMIITSASFPDFALYRQVKLMYEEFLSKQREYAAAALGRKAESHIDIQTRIFELEGYGKLLTEYPILLEYLRLTGNREEQ